ncbi:hypothetical protein EPA93_46415 [Ktedonosporobacter rubrisoli]|uniref:Uncharacterized protein n=1 Tax=Ktedonosporobacter rubrisoli TaxID=2509675 RepID=A0A4P6K401_KTERU|nr:DUF6022 family protein [Ktedonosporobacter rubrisoli]QBD83007.1 hypothetical protein EPA93_46415 [Ktedonosporobacter rubrisoli]
MKSLETFLSEKREVTIHTLASYIKQYIHEKCQSLLQEQQEELLRIFDQAGERAYGVFQRMLCQPIQEQLKQAGFVCEPDYPGDFQTSSLEYWGPPEERERCYWSTVKTAQGETLGTLVTQFFHDHTRFRIPRDPGILVLEETENEAIIAELSHASVRMMNNLQADLMQRRWAINQEPDVWEYSIEMGLADCLDSEHAEISGTLLDNTLSLWGHNGWELVTVIPQQGRLIGFFKRPAKRK